MRFHANDKRAAHQTEMNAVYYDSFFIQETTKFSAENTFGVSCGLFFFPLC
jgi:hypothetical protein